MNGGPSAVDTVDPKTRTRETWPDRAAGRAREYHAADEGKLMPSPFKFAKRERRASKSASCFRIEPRIDDLVRDPLDHTKIPNNGRRLMMNRRTQPARAPSMGSGLRRRVPKKQNLPGYVSCAPVNPRSCPQPWRQQFLPVLQGAHNIRSADPKNVIKEPGQSACLFVRITPPARSVRKDQRVHWPTGRATRSSRPAFKR